MPTQILICHKCGDSTGTTVEGYVAHYFVEHPGLPPVAGTRRLMYSGEDMERTAVVRDGAGELFMIIFMKDATFSIVDYPGGETILHDEMAGLLFDPEMLTLVMTALAGSEPYTGGDCPANCGCKTGNNGYRHGYCHG